MRKRFIHIVALCLFAITMLGAGTPSTTFDRLGHKLMCPCGCAEILLECNHVGCPDSDRMIGELRTQIASGLPETGVLNWFMGKYGPTVLAAPIRGGFDNVAWIVPFAALLLATLGVAALIRLWQRRHLHLQPAASSPEVNMLSNEIRERIRKETTFS